MHFAVWVVLSLAAAALVVAAGRRRDMLARAVLAALLAAGLAWGIGLALIASGWRDVDGFVDCHSHCSGWHRLGGALFFVPPVFAIGVALLALASAVMSARRS